MPYIQNALGLVIETLIGLYLLAIVLRFLFQLLRVDFRNPISQTIVKITNPALTPLRRLIPGLFGIDLAAVVLMLLVGLIKLYALLALSGYTPAPAGAVIYTVAEIINTIYWIFLIAIIIRALLSWFSVSHYHPAIRILDGISEPVLAPFRRLMPNLGGLDISPLFAILALNLVQKLAIYPLFDLGKSLF